MAKKNKSLRGARTTRALTVSMKTLAGSITMFYAFIDGRRIIAGPGTEDQEWSGNVPDGPVRLAIRVVGIGSARFELGIDLPGTAQDQALELSLTRGYYEASFAL